MCVRTCMRVCVHACVCICAILLFTTKCISSEHPPFLYIENPGQNVSCPLPPETMERPSSSNTSTIVAAVVGVLVGVVLIVLIVLLVVYYQCRTPDPVEATSRESAFDFSNKTAVGGGGAVVSEKARKGSKSDENGREEKQEATPPKEDLTENTTL